MRRGEGGLQGHSALSTQQSAVSLKCEVYPSAETEAKQWICSPTRLTREWGTPAIKLSKTSEGLSGPRILECVSELCIRSMKLCYWFQYLQWVGQPGGALQLVPSSCWWQQQGGVSGRFTFKNSETFIFTPLKHSALSIQPRTLHW